MIIGVVTRNPSSWASANLIRAFEALNHRVVPFGFSDIVAHVGNRLRLFVHGMDILETLSAIVVRPFGRVSLDQAIFRVDLLYAIQDHGVPVFNRPEAIEKCVDKFRSIVTLLSAGIPVPKTLVTERSSLALKSLELLGETPYLVVKPMFGSRGHGSTRIRVRDRDVLWEVVRALTFTRHTAYLQEFIQHRGVDIRAFVVGDRVLAAMYRVAPAGEWKTNVARGGSPKRIDRLDPVAEEMAIKAAKALHCDIAGVDLAYADGRYYIFEVNSQPGWRGLQAVFPEVDIAMEIAKYVVEKAKK